MGALRYVYLAVAALVTILVTLAHLSPATEFSLPLLPSSWTGHTAVIPPDPSESDNRQLSARECLLRYPALYLEADRAREWYSRLGGITESMVDEAEKDGGNARLTIRDNKLYVKGYYGGINTRTQAAMAAVYATLLTSPDAIPDVDFVIQTSDAGGGEHPHFVLDRRTEQQGLWLMPDFGFFAWPEPGVGAYSQVRSETLAYEESLGLRLNGSEVISGTLGKKIKKLLWRGVPMVEVRQELLRASEGQPWSEVKPLNWDAINQDEAGRQANNGDFKSPAEHCEYLFLAHVEGWAYSGRLKYLQQCRSVIVTHPLNYIQHYHHLFNGIDDDPDQNMVIVPLPLEENLSTSMLDLLSETSTAKLHRIIDNNWRLLREGYISPAANECYYRYALGAYAEVQRFEPSVKERGVPYESFLLMGTTDWSPHR